MFMYGTLLKNFGVMPSEIDNQLIEDFYTAMTAEEPKQVKYIDQLQGW